MNATIKIELSTNKDIYKVIDRLSKFVKRFIKSADVTTIIHKN